MPTIPYSTLAGNNDNFTPLFLDYISNYPNVSEYFNGDFHSTQRIGELAQSHTYDNARRQILVEVLKEQAAEFQSQQKALNNIELLAKPNTFAVVTGQQVGVFLGPMYTLYKTLTAIKCAKEYAEKFPAYNFIPVFWLEGEDHDFKEANNITLLNAENKLQKFTYDVGGIPTDKNLGAVGEVIFDFFFNDFKASVFASLTKTEFTESVTAAFTGAYRDGISFTTGFTRLMNTLLGDSGIVFMYPNDRRLKTLVAPLFKREILESPKTSQLIIEQSASLEQHYHAQFKPRAINLFFHHKEGRFALEPNQEQYWLKGTRKYFTKEELLTTLDESPEKFSPNVVLRPLCQDTLLPTVAYIGGPSEIAYFAQLKTLYEHFNIQMPLIIPRASLTIVESRVAKTAEKLHLQLEDFFRPKEELLRSATEAISETSLQELFTTSEQSIVELFERLAPHITGIDPTLGGALDNAKSKALYQITTLKERSITALQKKFQTSFGQLEKAIDSFAPNNNLQERELNILYFLNKYGLTFMQKLEQEMVVEGYEHQLMLL